MIMISVGLLIGLVLCLLLGVPYIDFLKKKVIGQYVLDVAPKTHAQKQGTPTTGGVFIVVAIILGSVITLFLAQKFTTTAWIILLTLLFYSLAGLQDDYLKIKGKVNQGLSPRAKLLRQIVIALLPSIYAVLTTNGVVFIGNDVLRLGWFYPLFGILVITGASNAYNLTDGLDGLAAGTGIFAFLACACIGFLSGNMEVAVISAVTAGVLIGFLRYNKPKAQVFMGDTGSIALGGLLGTLAVLGKFEFWLVILGAVFVIETLSVIIQVVSFKLTGKRVFNMAPIHHHFELLGWSEQKVVMAFTLMSFLFSTLACVVFYVIIKGLV